MMVDSTPASAVLRQRPVGGSSSKLDMLDAASRIQPQQSSSSWVDDSSDDAATSMVPADDLDRAIRRATVATTCAWAAAVLAVAYFAPAESFQYQSSDGASLALGGASLVMGASVATRGLALFFKEPDYASSSADCAGARTVAGSKISGVALAGFFVQACSCVMNGVMAVFPTPILLDPVTGMHVSLFRWCEWAPLAFLMAFLTAGMDADRRRGGMTSALNFGLSQGLSTLCGLLFPLLKPGASWWSVMAVSVLLHANLHVLLASKMTEARAVLKISAKSSTPPPSPAEHEKRERIRVASQLIQLLAVAWTILVVIYFAAWYFKVSPSTHAILECSVEVLSKHLYLNFLLDAHHLVFEGRDEWSIGSLDESSCDSDSSDEEDSDEEEEETRRKLD